MCTCRTTSSDSTYRPMASQCIGSTSIRVIHSFRISLHQSIISALFLGCFLADCSRQVGFLTFPQLTQVSLLRENMDNLIAASKTAASTLKPSACSTRGVAAVELAVPHLNGRSKIFELSSICDLAKVYIILKIFAINESN